MKSRPGQGLTVISKKILLKPTAAASRRTQRSPHTPREQPPLHPTPTLAASRTSHPRHHSPLRARSAPKPAPVNPRPIKPQPSPLATRQTLAVHFSSIAWHTERHRGRGFQQAPSE